MKKRIRYIDYLETIAIFLVVFCHFPSYSGSPVGNILFQLCAIAVPLFMMVNGALLLSTKFSLSKHIKKTILLLISIFVWKVIYYVAMYYYYKLAKDIVINMSMREWYSYLCGINPANIYIPSEHLWFMYMLISVYIIVPVIALYEDKKKKDIIAYLSILIFVFVFVICEVDSIMDIYMCNRGKEWIFLSVFKDSVYPFSWLCSYMFYFMIGYVIHNKFYQKNDRKITWYSLIAIVIMILVVLIEKYYQVGSFRGEAITLTNDYTRVSVMLLAVAVYIFACNTDFKVNIFTKISEFISVRTMNIYVIHMFLCGIWHWEIWPLLDNHGILLYLGRTICIVIISLIITEVISFIPGLGFICGIKPVRYHFKKKV